MPTRFDHEGIKEAQRKLLATLERRDRTAYVNEECWSRPERWVVNGRNYVDKTIRSFR